MTSSLKVSLRDTLKHDAQRVHASHKHVLTFGQKSADLWNLSSDSRSLSHRAALSPFINDPGREGVLVDEVLDLIIISNATSQPPSIGAYALHDGQLIRKVDLFGDLQDCRIHYSHGLALVVVQEYDNEPLPNQSTTLVLCDIAGGRGVLRKHKLPLPLAERDQTSPDDSFVPVLLTTKGDVIATSSAYYEENMAVMLWEGSDNPHAAEPPSKVIELPISLDGGDSIRPSCSTPLDDTSFLICAYEHVMDTIETSDSVQSVIYRLGTPSLDERWCAAPIEGRIHTMRYIASQDVIVAIGESDERDDAGDYDWSTVVATLDATTGALRRTEKINFGKHGSSVEYCDVTQTEGNHEAVVLFKNGEISITPLDEFLCGGFAKDGEVVKVSRVLEDTVEVLSGTITDRAAFLVTGPSEFSHVSW